MDLLGSILDSMDGPPQIDEKQKEQKRSKLNFFFKFYIYCVASMNLLIRKKKIFILF